MVTSVEHQPWPLWRTSVVELHDELVTAAHLPAPEEPPLAHFSQGVDVRVGYPRLVRRAEVGVSRRSDRQRGEA